MNHMTYIEELIARLKAFPNSPISSYQVTMETMDELVRLLRDAWPHHSTQRFKCEQGWHEFEAIDISAFPQPRTLKMFCRRCGEVRDLSS